MTILLTLVHILVCLFLILVVLTQQGKGQDLASAFGGAGSQAAFGARGTATLLTKVTAVVAATFMVTSLLLGTSRMMWSPRPWWTPRRDGADSRCRNAGGSASGRPRPGRRGSGSPPAGIGRRRGRPFVTGRGPVRPL